MRILILVLFQLLCFRSWGFKTFSGYINIQSQQRTIRFDNQVKLLSGETTDIESQIAKLKTNDFISGIGTINGNVLKLQTIDFIGLNQFLGLWMSALGIFQVEDFSNLKIYYPHQLQNPNLSQIQRPISSSTQNILNYSITPGEGNSWVLFLTDANQIYYTNLFMNEHKAVIRFYNTQTGAFLNEIAMSKLNSNLNSNLNNTLNYNSKRLLNNPLLNRQHK